MRKISKGLKIGIAFSALGVLLAVAGITAALVLLLSGSLEAEIHGEELIIDASLTKELRIELEDIDSIEYRESFIAGTRVFGVASMKLLTGQFKNPELGSYKLYSYTDARGFILLEAEGISYVIGLRDTAEAKALYEQIIG